MLHQIFGFEVFVKLISKDVTEFVNALLVAYEMLPDALDTERIEDLYRVVASFLHTPVMKGVKAILSPAGTKNLKRHGIDIETVLWC